MEMYPGHSFKYRVNIDLVEYDNLLQISRLGALMNG